MREHQIPAWRQGREGHCVSATNESLLPTAPPCRTGEVATNVVPVAGRSTMLRRCSVTDGASTAAASSAVSTALLAHQNHPSRAQACSSEVVAISCWAGRLQVHSAQGEPVPCACRSAVLPAQHSVGEMCPGHCCAVKALAWPKAEALLAQRPVAYFR